MSQSSTNHQPCPKNDSPKPVALNIGIETSITETSLQPGMYPVTSLSFDPSITSLEECQAQLLLEANYSKSTKCDVFEAREGESGNWLSFQHGVDFSRYSRTARDKSNQPSLRVLFVHLEKSAGTSFGCTSSMAQDDVMEMLSSFNVNPHFVPLLLGKQDSLAPLHNLGTGPNDALRFDFMCQFPRWQTHGMQEKVACSFSLSYDASTRSTFCIVACKQGEPFIQRVREVINCTFCSPTTASKRNSWLTNPFLLGIILINQSLLEGKAVMHAVRADLHKQLNVVDNLTTGSPDHTSLSTVTRDLYYLAEDCELMSADTEELLMIAKRVSHARNRMESILISMQVISPEAPLIYLCEAIETQKQRMQSNIARREAARTHVYQLVTQQNSQTNTQIALATQENSKTNTNIAMATQLNSDTNTNIARATLEDSAIMKVIAIVTMVFLPSSVVTSFFGMVFFSPGGDNGSSDSISRRLWVFWVVAIPLTCFVIVVSYLWWRWFDRRNSRKKSINSPSIVVTKDGVHIEEGELLPRTLLGSTSTLAQQISHADNGSATLFR